MIKLQGEPLDINISQVYAPTTKSSEDIDRLYDELDEAIKISKSQYCHGNGGLQRKSRE